MEQVVQLVLTEDKHGYKEMSTEQTDMVKIGEELAGGQNVTMIRRLADFGAFVTMYGEQVRVRPKRSRLRCPFLAMVTTRYAF